MVAARSWLAACRPGRALLAPSSVAVGASYARFDAHAGLGLGADALVVFAALAAGIGVHLLDRVWAPPAAAPEARVPTATEPRPVAPKDAGIAAATALAVAALAGFALVPMCGAGPLGYGALAVIVGAGLRVPTTGSDSRSGALEPIGTFLALGPLAAQAGFAAQTGAGSWGACLAGTPAGLIAVAALFRVRGAGGLASVPHERAVSVALPLIAAGSVALAVRAAEYGAWANAAAVPLTVAAGAAWMRPAAPAGREDSWAAGLLLACAVAALGVIVVSLGFSGT
jgi:hypothetical protein